MDSAPKITLSNSTLLNRFHDERALSILPNGYEPYFQLDSIVWGYDLIEEVNGKPSCQNIPLDKTSINNLFYESKGLYNYIDGKIVITSSIPSGAFSDSEAQHHFSCLGVKDRAGGLVAIAVTQPIWIYNDRGVTAEIIIHTARSDQTSLKLRG